MGPIRDNEFRTASFCGNHAMCKCVAVAIRPKIVAIRDTKDPEKVTLTFTHDEWRTFVSGVRKGEFDVVE